MNYLIAFILLLSITVANVLANSQQGLSQKQQHNKPDAVAIANYLGLDAYQSAELQNLMQQHHNAMRTTHQQLKVDQQNIHNIRQSHRKNLLNILSYEQLYKLDNYMKQHHPRPEMSIGRHGNKPKSIKKI